VQWRGDAVSRCSESPRQVLLCKNNKNNNISKKFWQNLPCTGRFPKPAKKEVGSMADSTYTTRMPHIHKAINITYDTIADILTTTNYDYY
jgi:hypothetical protein